MKPTWLLILLLTTGAVLADDPAKKPPPAAPAKKDAEPARKDAEAAKKEAEPAKDTADGAEKPEAEAEAKSKHDADLGMSILGNQEAPKSLVIVPWKSSEIGQSLGISTLLDDSRQPIDKEVFMRVLSYYDVMSTTTTKGRKP